MSYDRRQSEGVPHNLVTVCRVAGMSAQEAIDHLGSLLDERYARWEVVVNGIPSWGEKVDGEVEKYIMGMKNVVRGTLYWRSVCSLPKSIIFETDKYPHSFWSERYFGKEHDVVLQTRKISVLQSPPFVMK